MLTSSMRANPAGRAAAIYTYGNGELFDRWQTLVVGADRDSYRRLDGRMTRRHERPGGNSQELLAPDGSSLVIAKPKHCNGLT